MLFASGTHTNLNEDEYLIPLAVGGCDPFISPTCPPTTHSHIYMRMDNIVNSSSSFTPCYVFSFLLTSSLLTLPLSTALHLHPSIHPLLYFTYLSLSSCNPGWPVCVWAWGAAGAGPGQGEHQQRDGGSSSSPRGGGHIWAAKRLPIRHYRHQWVVWEWPLWQNHIPANTIVHWDIMPHREWKLGIQEGFIGSL